MTLFTVDRHRCKRDGICVAECPQGVIEINDPDTFPSLIESGEQVCINCGHCVAVCPHGAFMLATMKPEDCAPVMEEILPSAAQVEHFLKSRRSARAYKDKSVAREVLAKVIEIAAYAPSGHNNQPVHWTVIEDSKELHRLTALTIDWMRSMLETMPHSEVTLTLEHFVDSWQRGGDPVLRGAPHLIIAHADKSVSTSPIDCTIALCYLELAAHSMGLAACWAGAIQMAAALYPPVAEALKLPSQHRCFGAMMMGYPEHRFRRIPLRDYPQVNWR